MILTNYQQDVFYEPSTAMEESGFSPHIHQHRILLRSFLFLFLSLFICFETDREGEREGENEYPKQAPCCQHRARCGSISWKRRSWPGLKSRVRCLTDWATQVPLDLFLFFKLNIAYIDTVIAATSTEDSTFISHLVSVVTVVFISVSKIESEEYTYWSFIWLVDLMLS